MDSRDIIISLALEYDLPTLLNYCRTSKRINDLVCNNNLFWVSKLKKDFGITSIPENTAKEYYKELTSWISKYSNINELYFDAVAGGRLDLVKIGLDRGANINYVKYFLTPLIAAFLYNQNEIFDYLLEKGAIDSEDKIMKNFMLLLDYYKKSDINTKRILVTGAYERILPKIYKLKNPELKRIWKIALQFLEDNRNLLPKVYDKRINEIRALAMD